MTKVDIYFISPPPDLSRPFHNIQPNHKENKCRDHLEGQFLVVRPFHAVNRTLPAARGKIPDNRKFSQVRAWLRMGKAAPSCREFPEERSIRQVGHHADAGLCALEQDQAARTIATAAFQRLLCATT